jgi:hypothetical protein
VQDKERQELRRQLVPGKDAQEQRPRFVPDKERQEQRGRFKPCKDAQEQRYRFVPDKGAQELRRRFVPPRETDQGTGAGAVTLFPSGGLVFSGTGRDERNQLKKREKWDLAVLLIGRQYLVQTKAQSTQHKCSLTLIRCMCDVWWSAPQRFYLITSRDHDPSLCATLYTVCDVGELYQRRSALL